MTRAINDDIGHIPRARLAALLPEHVPIRKGKNGKLYLSTPWASWFMNTPGGQDALLEHGMIYGPEDVLPVEVVPVAAVADQQAAAANDGEEPVAANDENHEIEKPKKAAGGWFGLE